MALIKCKECERKISSHAKACPNCGGPVPKICPECGEEIAYNNTPCSNCGYQKPKNNKASRLIVGFVFIIFGSLSIIWGLGLSYSGVYTSHITYGGDAYTGIQNASADTSKNVESLGNFLCESLKDIMIVLGGSLDGFGLYVISKKSE